MRSTALQGIVLGLLLLMIVLLVPSATPVAIGDSIMIGPFQLTLYGVVSAAGVLMAVLVTVSLGLRKLQKPGTLLGGLSWGILGALLGARILYCLAMIEPIVVDYSLQFIPQLWKGGYTLFGGIAGGLAGVWLYARSTKQPAKELLDAFAPGAAVMLMAVRLAERFTTQGLGFFVDNEAWQWFPIAVQDAYGYFAAPVYVYEAFAAVVIAVICSAMLLRRKSGTATIWFLALLSLSQILLDSWRQDEYIRFGFVHLNQLAAIATLTILVILSVRRRVMQSGWKPWQIIRSAAFVLLTGVLVWIEFALDKSNISNVILYVVMAVALLGMGVAVLHSGKQK